MHQGGDELIVEFQDCVFACSLRWKTEIPWFHLNSHSVIERFISVVAVLILCSKSWGAHQHKGGCTRCPFAQPRCSTKKVWPHNNQSVTPLNCSAIHCSTGSETGERSNNIHTVVASSGSRVVGCGQTDSIAALMVTLKLSCWCSLRSRVVVYLYLNCSNVLLKACVSRPGSIFVCRRMFPLPRRLQAHEWRVEMAAKLKVRYYFHSIQRVVIVTHQNLKVSIQMLVSSLTSNIKPKQHPKTLAVDFWIWPVTKSTSPFEYK